MATLKSPIGAISASHWVSALLAILAPAVLRRLRPGPAGRAPAPAPPTVTVRSSATASSTMTSMSAARRGQRLQLYGVRFNNSRGRSPVYDRQAAVPRFARRPAPISPRLAFEPGFTPHTHSSIATRRSRYSRQAQCESVGHRGGGAPGRAQCATCAAVGSAEAISSPHTTMLATIVWLDPIQFDSNSSTTYLRYERFAPQRGGSVHRLAAAVDKANIITAINTTTSSREQPASAAAPWISEDTYSRACVGVAGMALHNCQ